jgi:hypothetical protein
MRSRIHTAGESTSKMRAGLETGAVKRDIDNVR